MTLRLHRHRSNVSAAALTGAVAFTFIACSITMIVPASRAGDAAKSGPATLPETSPSTQSAEIEALAQQLSSDDWRQRDRAQERLLDLGAEAEPVLKRFVDQTASPEARARAQETLARIADRRWTGPSMVTLHRRNALPGTVLDELFKQAAGTYATWPPALFQDGASAPLDVDFDHTPFLAAFKEVCGKAGLNARFVYDRRRITVTRDQSAPMFGPSIVDGPVLVAAEGVSASANVRFANPVAASRSGSLSFQVLLEPRLRITHGWFEVLKMEDQNGKSLVQEGGNAANRAMPNFMPSANSLTFNSEFYWAGRVSLLLPRDSTKIAVFKANLHLQAHARTERVEIRDILNAKEITKTVDGRRFTLHDVVLNGYYYRMQLTLYRGNMSEQDWAWFSYPFSRIRLVDSNDQDLTPSSGGRSGGPNESTFNMTMTRQAFGQPAPPGEPVALIWELPLKTREIIVPVEFSDLPLP